MKLEKQDVFIKKDVYDKETDSIITLPDCVLSAAKCIKGVYILTETQLETLKQEYYGIGVKYGQENK